MDKEIFFQQTTKILLGTRGKPENPWCVVLRFSHSHFCCIVSWAGKLNFLCPSSRLRNWSRGTGLAVSSCVSLLIFYTQAETYELYSLLPLSSAMVSIKTVMHHWVSSEFIRLCNCVFITESPPGIGPVVLGVDRWTRVAYYSGKQSAPLVSHTHYLLVQTTYRHVRKEGISKSKSEILGTVESHITPCTNRPPGYCRSGWGFGLSSFASRHAQTVHRDIVTQLGFGIWGVRWRVSVCVK